MYSESDIEAAIAAGAMTPEAAAALRAHAETSRAGPQVDEENIRLVTSFNDIFVTIASILVLIAVGWIGGSFETGSGYVLVAATSWALAEYFTRVRNMALPSILLLAAFVMATFGASVTFSTGADFHFDTTNDLNTRALALRMVLAAGLTGIAAWLHWRRFHVPITVAAGTGVLVILILAAITALIPGAQRALLQLSLIAGIGVFAFAMWWDISDRERITRRSDVAFWLHLYAAPMIVHPIFWLLGLLEGQASTGRALAVVVLYLVFGIVALAVDRRALLVSALFYVLYALSTLFKQFGAIQLSFAFTAAIIGSALLLLSAFWHPARALIVAMLPTNWQSRLPALNRPRP
jgi:hypothetical protein